MLDKIEVRKELGLRIRELRKRQNISIKDFAYKIDMEYNNLIRIEKGRTNLTIATLVKVANGLGIDMIELFKNESARD
ncbi:MAG: helix-turn-helix transcriptional regulator [Rikenellaceae bacterium]|nr:helix-turn-helix transcriptional regulator [Rikenellaceae bacterium]